MAVVVSQIPCVTTQPTHEELFLDQCEDEFVLDAEISSVLSSVKDLLKKYRMYSKASPSSVVSGGLQQYLIRKIKQKNSQPETAIDRLQALYINNTAFILPQDEVYKNQADLSTPRFATLPVNLKLHIFSFLTAKELSQASRVCRDWNQLTADSLLWQRRLDIDIPSWGTISHIANPNLYKETESEMTDKEIYLKCSPDVQQRLREQASTFHHVSQVLKSFLPKKAPKVAMFGPGLESDTSGIVRKMLYEDNTTFHRVAMFPGQFEGMGAGMTLKLPSGNSFHLTVLYTATYKERTDNQHRDRMANSKLLNRNKSAPETETYELQQSIKDLCHTLDAFVFVVDASGTREAVEKSHRELQVMVEERWSAIHVPVLVLACIPQSSGSRLPAIDIVHALKLEHLNRPWMVQNVVVEDLVGVEKGIQWVVDQSQYK